MYQKTITKSTLMEKVEVVAPITIIEDVTRAMALDGFSFKQSMRTLIINKLEKLDADYYFSINVQDKNYTQYLEALSDETLLETYNRVIHDANPRDFL